MLGEQHFQVVSGKVGSARHTLLQLRQLIRWLAEGTKEMRGAFVGQDDASAAILCGLKSIQDTEFTFPTRPDGAFSPFDFSEPIPGDGDDPSAVLAMLDAGDDSEIYALAEYWRNLSSSLNETVDALVRARTQLEENTGEAIDAAAGCCTQVMATAQIFADNATAMHASVSQLPHIRQAARTQIAAIEAEHTAAVAAATNPAGVRAAGEAARAATREFMTGPYQAMLTAAVPPLRNLTERPNVGQGGGHLTTQAPSPINSPSTVSTTVTPAMAATGAVGGAPTANNAPLNPTHPATINADNVATTTNHPAPTAPITPAAQTSPNRASNVGSGPRGTAPTSISGDNARITPGGVSGNSFPRLPGNTPSPGYTPRTTQTPGRNLRSSTPNNGLGGTNRIPINSGHAPHGNGNYPRNGVNGSGQLNKPGEIPRNRSVIIHPGPDTPMPRTGDNPHYPGSTPGEGKNTAPHYGRGAATPSPTGGDGSRPAMGRMGIAPMGGYGNSSKSQKQEPEGKYKPITSEFEAEYNLRQLRGDIGLTTPHVIGAQLREPK
ncbi:hypothetical protein [Corynebacterium sp.]|uniref:hypothetical protein n=1 Tax=Corynebacterium sp. TaxID=1720 RepID=UPI0026DBA95E|nr:hypothetical protein [Corynebacterium sp.]MDO4915255.1 hypothetical protein [Corynebacterium sp.]